MENAEAVALSTADLKSTVQSLQHNVEEAVRRLEELELACRLAMSAPRPAETSADNAGRLQPELFRLLLEFDPPLEGRTEVEQLLCQAKAALQRQSAAAATPPPVSLLPPALLVSIFALTDGASVGRAACVCRSWSEAAQSDWLWNGLCDARGGAASFPKKHPSWRAAFAERHSLPRAVRLLVREAAWPLRRRQTFAALSQLDRAHPRLVWDLLEEGAGEEQAEERAMFLRCLWALGANTFTRVASAEQEASSQAGLALLLDAVCALDWLVLSDSALPSSRLQAHVVGLGEAFRSCLSALGLAGPEADPVARIRALNRFLFGEAEGVTLPNLPFLPHRADLCLLFGPECLAGATAGRAGLGLTACPPDLLAAPESSTLTHLLRTRQANPTLLVILQLHLAAAAGVALAAANVPYCMMSRTPPHLACPPTFFHAGSAGDELTAPQVVALLDLTGTEDDLNEENTWGTLEETGMAGWRTEAASARAVAQRLLHRVVERPSNQPIPFLPLLTAYIAAMQPQAWPGLSLRLRRLTDSLEEGEVSSADVDVRLLTTMFKDTPIAAAAEAQAAKLAALRQTMRAQEASGEQPVAELQTGSVQERWESGEFE